MISRPTITLQTQLSAAKRANLVPKIDTTELDRGRCVYRCYLYPKGVRPDTANGGLGYVGRGDSFLSIEDAMNKALKMAFERMRDGVVS